MIGRKSQAALEFIMTYGWAILVVLVAIGALAYFGVLSPDKFLPSKCLLQSGIACLEHKVTINDVTVVLQNSLGDDITNVVVHAGNCGDSPATTLTNGQNSGQIVITCVPAGAFAGLSKYSNTLNITYISGNGVSHTNNGQITARIET